MVTVAVHFPRGAGALLPSKSPTCILRTAVFTVCGAVPELRLKLLSPEYEAVSVLPPALVDVMEQPPAATEAEQLAPVPSSTVTVPAGVPAPGAFGTTVKLTVYAWPVALGSGESLVIVVVVSALFTV